MLNLASSQRWLRVKRKLSLRLPQVASPPAKLKSTATPYMHIPYEYEKLRVMVFLQSLFELAPSKTLKFLSTNQCSATSFTRSQPSEDTSAQS